MANDLFIKGVKTGAVSIGKLPVKRIFRGNTKIWSPDEKYEFFPTTFKKGDGTAVSVKYPYTLEIFPGKYKVVCIGGGGNSVGSGWDEGNVDWAWCASGGSGACISGTFTTKKVVYLSIAVGGMTFAYIVPNTVTKPDYGEPSTVVCNSIGLNVRALGGINMLGSKGRGWRNDDPQTGFYAKLQDCYTGGLTLIGDECFDGKQTNPSSQTGGRQKSYPRDLEREILRYGLSYSVDVYHPDGPAPKVSILNDDTAKELGEIGGYVLVESMD